MEMSDQPTAAFFICRRSTQIEAAEPLQIKDQTYRVQQVFTDEVPANYEPSVAFQRPFDRHVFEQAVRQGITVFLAEANFFTAIGQVDYLSQMTVSHILKRLGFQLVCLTGGFNRQDFYLSEKVAADFLPQYDKSYMSLLRFRASVRKEITGGKVTMEGKGKVLGRQSIIEREPELVERLKSLWQKGYKQVEIVRILQDLGYVNLKGNPYQSPQIGQILRRLRLK